MAEKVWANGIWGNEREEQPDFVVGNIAIVPDKFVAWLAEQEPDARGYVRVNVTRQKNQPTKWSFSLDTWGKDKQDGQSQDAESESLSF